MILKEFVLELNDRPFKCYRNSDGLMARVKASGDRKAVLVIE